MNLLDYGPSKSARPKFKFEYIGSSPNFDSKPLRTPQNFGFFKKKAPALSKEQMQNYLNQQGSFN